MRDTVLVAESAAAVLARGANGFGLPTGSSTIGVEKSCREVNAASVNIVPLRSMELTVRNVWTSVGSTTEVSSVVVMDVCD